MNRDQTFQNGVPAEPSPVNPVVAENASNISNTSNTSVQPSSATPPLPTSAPRTPNTDKPAHSPYFANSIFWIDVDKIRPNPYQPRREFEQVALKDLSESIRMYGLLQPLVVTRREIVKPDGGLAVEYELISGERRLRASKLASLTQVPCIIRAGEEDARVKLELAIIENLQREDLNSVDRAYAFQRLADEFGFKHAQIAEKMGKSREYVTNTIRLLALPKHMLAALSEGKITEGHTRPLLMLATRPEEQETLFKEIIFKKITVREAEQLARGIAVERVRKKGAFDDPEMHDIAKKLNEALGTRVQIEKREVGGKLVIDFFNNEDLRHLLDLVSKKGVVKEVKEIAGIAAAKNELKSVMEKETTGEAKNEQQEVVLETPADAVVETPTEDNKAVDDAEEQDLYSVKNFSL